MGTIRRTFGGFAVAVIVAAGLVLMPASLHAKVGNGNSGTATGFCDTLASAIDYISTNYEDPIKSLALAPLLAAQSAYCPL